MTAQGDVNEDAVRLLRTVRSLTFGATRAYSAKALLGRRMGEVLKWRAKWLGQSFDDILRQAKEGQCSEVARKNACLPWVPTAREDWHPDLARSLNARARERGTYDQEEIDNQIIVATGLRILTEWGVDSIPKGQEEREARERDSLLKRLEAEIVRRIEDAVPYHLRQQATALRAKDVPAEVREQLSHRFEESLDEELTSRTVQVQQRQSASSWAHGAYTGSAQGSTSSSSSGWHQPRGGSSWWSQSWWRG